MLVTKTELDVFSIAISTHIQVASGDHVGIDASWFNDSRRGWEFCVQCNLVDRNDWAIKANIGSSSDLRVAFQKLGAKVTLEECNQMAQIIHDFRVKNVYRTQSCD